MHVRKSIRSVHGLDNTLSDALSTDEADDDILSPNKAG